MSLIYPSYEVVHGTYIPSNAAFYLLQYQGAAGANWVIPPNFAQMIITLNLQAAANTLNNSAYQNAYVVGSGTGYWATDAAAKAAAIADYGTIIAARNSAAAAAALTQGFLGNPYITPSADSPVAGPG